MRVLCSMLLALAAGTASAMTYCPSNHGTGYVDFDPYTSQALLYLDGTGQFHGGVAYLSLSCVPDANTDRQAWTCTEPAPYSNPDGRTSLGIEVSYEYYLMVASRLSDKFHGEIVVDDFDCYR